MSDANGESKFGFKDKEKAQETLQLLESHDMQYRKLTVRGLLGRAKRVLSMTKAEEKVKNINEAIEIFENWLAENGGGAANQNTTTDVDDKVETVPGLGFKDKEAAEKTLKILAERDPEYQKLAIKGLIGNSKRVLSGTKNEEKVKSIQEGIKVLEEFLEIFDTQNMMKSNKSYLAFSLVEQFPSSEDELAVEFLNTYGGPTAKGNYKRLRTMFPKFNDTTSWDIIRNRKLIDLSDKLEAENGKLFDANTGEPTQIHLNMINWAYSPQPEKVKAYVEKLNSSNSKTVEKRKSSNLAEECENGKEDLVEDESTQKKKIRAE